MNRTEFISHLKQSSNNFEFIYDYLILTEINYNLDENLFISNSFDFFKSCILDLIKHTPFKQCSVNENMLIEYIKAAHYNPFYFNSFSSNGFLYLSFNDIFDLLDNKPMQNLESIFRLEVEDNGFFQAVILHRFFVSIDLIIEHQTKRINQLTDEEIYELNIIKKIKKTKNTIKITEKYISNIQQVMGILNIKLPEWFNFIENSNIMPLPKEDGYIKTIFSPWSHSYHKDWYFGFKSFELLLDWIDKSKTNELAKNLNFKIYEYKSDCVISSDHQVIFKKQSEPVLHKKF